MTREGRGFNPTGVLAGEVFRGVGQSLPGLWPERSSGVWGRWPKTAQSSECDWHTWHTILAPLSTVAEHNFSLRLLRHGGPAAARNDDAKGSPNRKSNSRIMDYLKETLERKIAKGYLIGFRLYGVLLFESPNCRPQFTSDQTTQHH